MDPGAGTEDKPLQRRSVELNDSGPERANEPLLSGSGSTSAVLPLQASAP